MNLKRRRTVTRLLTRPLVGDVFVPHYTRLPWPVRDPVRIERIAINEQPERQ